MVGRIHQWSRLDLNFLYGKISTLSISVTDVRLFRLFLLEWALVIVPFKKAVFISGVRCLLLFMPHTSYLLKEGGFVSVLFNIVSLCLFFLALTRDLLVLLIYLKESALDSWIFSTVILFSISSISVLISTTPSFGLPSLQFALVFLVS